MSEHALMRYIEDNTSETLQKSLANITNIADTDETKASIYMETMLISAINAPKNTDIVFNQLFNKPLGSLNKKALNESLLFQLSEDRNFNITDISHKNLILIQNYINKQNLSNNDWDIVNNRIDKALNNPSENK